MASLRQLPSIDQLLQRPQVGKWVAHYGRSLTVDALRHTLDQVRALYPQTADIPGEADLLQRAGEMLKSWTSPSLLPVINATGVILHTNLGRAPLSRAALQAIQEVALGYSNLEYELEKGQRGSRLQLQQWGLE